MVFKQLITDLEPHELERILFLKSKIINSRDDIIETGDIILTALRRKQYG